MKKKIVVIALIAVLLTAICVVTVIKHKTVSSESTKPRIFYDAAEALDAASFNMEYSDRLSGCMATEFEVNSSTVEITYADAGFIRKTLGVTDNSGNQDEFDEVNEQEINGMTVTFKGKEGHVYLATWSYNNFAYTISVNEGVEADEMINYVEATR